jgi:glycosyltransferase involved in cell wall biosynthesis
MCVRSVFLIGTRWFGVLGPCRQIIAELERRRVRVFVFGQEDEHWRRYHNGRTTLVVIHMRRSYMTFLHDFLDVCKIAWYGIRYRPSVVHSFNPKPALLSFAAALFMPGARLLIGVTGLGNTFIRAKRMEGLVTSVLRMACARASFIFFQNPDDRQLFRERRLGDESKYRIFVGPGVDLTEFDAARRRHKSESEPVRVVCVARLIWQKGIREYVEAARRIRADRTHGVEFLLVGDFDRQHPDCVDEAYIAAAVADGSISHIRWTDRLPEILAECDIAVLHSYREGAPRAILEASAMKIPTIGSDAIGVRELIVHRETGLLTPLRSIDAVAAAIEELIDDRDLRIRFGNNAFTRIAQPLSLEHATAAQLKMYEGAL